MKQTEPQKTYNPKPLKQMELENVKLDDKELKKY